MPTKIPEDRNIIVTGCINCDLAGNPPQSTPTCSGYCVLKPNICWHGDGFIEIPHYCPLNDGPLTYSLEATEKGPTDG